MCFQRKTIINQTGLGDEQYQDLQVGQQDIGGQIEEGFVGAGTRLDSVDAGITGLGSKIDTTGNTINTGFSDLNTYLQDQFTTNQNNQQQLAQNQTVGFTDLNALNQARFDNLTTDFSGLQGSVDEGFMSAGSRFDDIDAANQNIQQDVTTGFSDQAREFNNADAALAQSTGDIRGDITNNFDATNKSLADAQTNIRGDITASQSEILGGQGGLASSLNDMSDTNDIYFGTLSEGQGNLQAGQDNFRTTFDNYVDRYSDDTTLANQTRADMQRQMVNSTDLLSNQMATSADAAAAGQQNLSTQLADTGTQLQSDVTGGFQQTADNQSILGQTLRSQISDVNAGLMTNQDNLAAGQETLTQAFSDGMGGIDTKLVTQTRDLANIAATQTDLDMGMRQNFNQLGQAFDDNGQLIKNSIDANGNTIMREMDTSGNLMLRAMDAQGRDLGSKVINVNESVSQLGELQRRMGGNVNMGQLSPATQMSGGAQLSGFAQPYTTTR